MTEIYKFKTNPAPPILHHNSTSLSEFKTKVKNQKGGEIFLCRLCKSYLLYMDTSDMMEVWNFLYSYKNFAQVNSKNNDFTPFFTLYL